MPRIFWTLLFFIGVASLLLWSGPLKRPIVALRLALEEPPKSLPLPVAGVSSANLRDTWGAPRPLGKTGYEDPKHWCSLARSMAAYRR
jgi:hypothetical protein